MARAGTITASLLALALALACTPDPQPRTAFEGEPLRVLQAGELPKLGEVEGFAVEVVREGSGDAVARGTFARAHYIVLLHDGTQLDSSHGKDPLLVRVGEDASVLEGMQLGMIGMKVGELRRITVPPKLGYRNRTNVGVPPNTNLTFLVELVQIR
jgi:FKBP-type peptidyl-prolyl cis-trans isomerase